jgi:hypothetical protein
MTTDETRATSLLCHHADYCGKPAVHACASCQWHYCADHFFRASFSGPGLSVPVAFDTCQVCLVQLIEQQYRWGRKLSHWHKAG